MGTPKGAIPHNAGKGKGWTDSRGYRVQSKTVNGKRFQVREHRAIMESHLGRALEPWEIVHHKDGNPANNALDNLEVQEFGEHTAQHHQGSRHSYNSRRTMEAFANLRESLQRERAVKSDLLAALEEIIAEAEGGWLRQSLIAKRALAALAKARGQ